MKKQERMKQLQQMKRNELKEAVMKRAEELGQGFVDYELPPDEVDEDMVKRSLWTSLRTFIPYTNEWYEAKAAEEEMDDLKKIRIERVKAEDLYHMSKIGKHDDALLTMLSETNYDYFYFNKLKYKMENEGKFKFELPRENNLFLMLEKGPNKNRLRKAINQAYSFMDDKMTNELARLASVSDGSVNQKRYTNDNPCMWRGKNKQGVNFRCDNVRMIKPIRKDEQNDNVQTGNNNIAKLKKGEVECFPYCCYHVPFCVSEDHEPDARIKIRIPNTEALCAECYMMKLRKRPPPFNMETCPGITAVITNGKGY